MELLPLARAPASERSVGIRLARVSIVLADVFYQVGGRERRRPRLRRLVTSARTKRLTLIAAILGSGIALLDGTIVSVALPTIQRSLGGGLAGQQWVSSAYLLTLGSLILVGGSLGDIFGERRVFALGVTGFGLASLLCALAPTIGLLAVARGVQGITGALLTPSSL